MAVVFYLDPSIAKDPEHDTLKSITLSYTFFPLPDKVTPVADANDKPNSSGKL